MIIILFYLLLAFVGFFGTIVALKGIDVLTRAVSQKVPAPLSGFHSSLMTVTLFCWGLSILSIVLHDGPIEETRHNPMAVIMIAFGIIFCSQLVWWIADFHLTKKKVKSQQCLDRIKD